MRLGIFLSAIVILVVATACGSSDSAPNGSTQPTVPTNTLMRPPVGDVATPDFTLPLATGGTIRFSDYLGSQPVAVVFYRGFF